MSEKQQKLVLSIIDFLNQSIDDGTVKQDDKESLEVAIQCIGEAFGVDPSDEGQVKHLSVKPATLPTIFDVFLKTREKIANPGSASASATSSTTPARPQAASAADKANAEKLKQTGNSFMTSKKFDQAIDSYTQAIALDPTNAVYYSNRAAAHISKSDYSGAVLDAQKAIDIDPAFVRAYSRLGHAHYSLGDYSAAADAYRTGLQVDPTNAGLKNDLASAEARLDEDLPPPLESDELSSNAAAGAGAGAGGLGGMADMLRGMGMGGGAGGPGGGAGGMPDLAGLMNNPMMMQMAQQMMANGGMERLMNNPNVANMMNRMQSGGGMPSMAEIMQDPALRDLAGQFGAGAGAGAGS